MIVVALGLGVLAVGIALAAAVRLLPTVRLQVTAPSRRVITHADADPFRQAAPGRFLSSRARDADVRPLAVPVDVQLIQLEPAEAQAAHHLAVGALYRPVALPAARADRNVLHETEVTTMF